MAAKMRKLLCGKNSVLDALESNLPIKTLYLTKPLNIHIGKNIEIRIVSRIKLDQLTNANHQGYAAELQEYNYFNLDIILRDKPSKVLIIDHIQDPHNFGAIIRSANASGLQHIIIPKDRQVGITPTVLKVSSGGYIGIKIIRVSSIVDAIKKLKKNKFWIYASSLKNGHSLDKTSFNYPLAIIVGNENSGVSNSVLKQSDQNIYISMNGTVQSLNVSVATGIILFKI